MRANATSFVCLCTLVLAGCGGGEAAESSGTADAAAPSDAAGFVDAVTVRVTGDTDPVSAQCLTVHPIGFEEAVVTVRMTARGPLGAPQLAQLTAVLSGRNGTPAIVDTATVVQHATVPSATWYYDLPTTNRRMFFSRTWLPRPQPPARAVSARFAFFANERGPGHTRMRERLALSCLDQPAPGS